MGPCSQGRAACSEIDTLAVTSGDDTQLTLTVTAVSYGLNDGRRTSVNASPGPSTAVGDSIRSRPTQALRALVPTGTSGTVADMARNLADTTL